MHSETGEPPLARWARGIPDPLPLPTPAQLHEAFLWSERRTVKKTATVSVHGNLYQVDASLVRCTVELVFDSFDLSGIHHNIVTVLSGRPAHGTAALTAQAYDVLAGEAAERGRTPS